MAKSRKGQGLSLNVMILAILALVVLIVLIAIFSRQSGTSIRSIESCEGKGGECRAGQECKINEIKLDSANCPSQNQICCINVFAQNTQK